MATHSIPTVPRLWAEHERVTLEVFTSALQDLRSCDNLPMKENKISARLAVAVRRAAFSLGLDYPPRYELPRQPTSESDIDGPGAEKRPDFTSTIRDPSATSATNAWLDYHVECKCLGEPSSRAWKFNKNYAERGVHRFLDPRHGYGARVFSGAMIGYVLSMSFAEILEEVNGHLRQRSGFGAAPPIRFPGLDFPHDGMARTSQTLDRTHVGPRQFALRHVWVDLRPGPAS